MKIGVIIPCYKVKKHILNVLKGLPEYIEKIYIIDDKCPDMTGRYVGQNTKDGRVHIIFHEKNKGVGGSVISGYRQAIQDNLDIVLKIDGDGQMDPTLIPAFVLPIASGDCDYTKGNRFYNPEDLARMPLVRIIGNAALSFLTKFSSGQWHIFDPTNGYTAVSVQTLRILNLDKVSQRYFFESDMLFRLNLIGATVKDIPMKAVYDDQTSNLHISKIVAPFLLGHSKNFLKRILYDYLVRDFSIATVSLFLGLALCVFGFTFGAISWFSSMIHQQTASGGTVMLASLPIIIGIQLLLNFLNYDIQKSKRTYRANYFFNKEKANSDCHNFLFSSKNNPLHHKIVPIDEVLVNQVEKRRDTGGQFVTPKTN